MMDFPTNSIRCASCDPAYKNLGWTVLDYHERFWKEKDIIKGHEIVDLEKYSALSEEEVFQEKSSGKMLHMVQEHLYAKYKQHSPIQELVLENLKGPQASRIMMLMGCTLTGFFEGIKTKSEDDTFQVYEEIITAAFRRRLAQYLKVELDLTTLKQLCPSFSRKRIITHKEDAIILVLTLLNEQVKQGSSSAKRWLDFLLEMTEYDKIDDICEAYLLNLQHMCNKWNILKK